MKKVVIFYGAPGAGKGTQAELVAKRFYFIHFDTGRYLESEIYNPYKKEDPVWQEAKACFESGKLVDPNFVLNRVVDATNRMADSGVNIVYSGSPRTVYEAFGDNENKGLMDVLESKYGKEDIVIFYLDISEEETMRRNSTRRVCSVCGLPILGESKIESCAFCGGKPRVRTLDDPEVIKERIIEFKKVTLPVLEKLERNNFSVYKIDGSGKPYEVFEKIIDKLK
jgi:adenylate kinase